MSKVIYDGRICEEFNGFDENTIFKMDDGTYWVQNEYRYWYHYEYRPKVVITLENGINVLTVGEQSVSVKRIFDIIESKIDGTFNGWKGNTVYKLSNGQIWQQIRYKYQYKYAYCPDAMVCNVNGLYIMYVEGTQAVVKRLQKNML